MRVTATEARAARLARLRGLYAVTPDALDTDALLARCAAAIDGGASAIQYRRKDAEPALAEAQARALVALCRARGALAIVNDDAALAARVDADGVHVGEHDAAPAAARARVGPARLVGVSCYDSLMLARRAVDAGADYVAFGSFFPSGTKPNARRASVEMLPLARALGVPLVAIGGIDASNARLLAEAGVDAVAVIAAVFAHESLRDVTGAAQAIAAAFPSFERLPR